MVKNGMRPVHPGEVLREDYLVPAGLSVNTLATALHVPVALLHDIVRERRPLTADLALRIAHHFGTDAQSWINLQANYDHRLAECATAFRREREMVMAVG